SGLETEELLDLVPDRRADHGDADQQHAEHHVEAYVGALRLRAPVDARAPTGAMKVVGAVDGMRIERSDLVDLLAPAGGLGHRRIVIRHTEPGCRNGRAHA